MLSETGLQNLLQFRQPEGWPFGSEEDPRQPSIDEDDSDDQDSFIPMLRRHVRAARRRPPAELPPVPNPEGKKLMSEGHFGTDQYYVDRLKQRKKSLATNLMWRELGVDPPRSTQTCEPIHFTGKFTVSTTTCNSIAVLD